MPERYGPLGESYEAAQLTEMRVAEVRHMIDLDILPASELLRHALHEPVEELRREAEVALGARLDKLEQALGDSLR